jgi:hypothetical protein
VIREIWQRAVSENTRHTVHSHKRAVQERGLLHYTHWNALLIDALVRARARRSDYTYVRASDVAQARRSDKVFVFGSGYSLNEIRSDEWDHIREHDVFGFNAFVYERWVPIHFHLLRGGAEGSLQWRAYAEEISGTIRRNPQCQHTIFLMQSGYEAQFCNQLLGYGFMEPGTKVLEFTTLRGDGPPSQHFEDGLRHVGGTLSDAVNAAACLGWREIVLVGVDLYDSRYFWLPPNETPNIDHASGTLSGEYNTVRGTRFDDVHNTVRIGIVDVMASWTKILGGRGIALSVFNPRSLLSQVMPIYRLD